MAIERVGIVGAGAMGSGIIEVVAKAGVAVVARDISPEAVEAGRGRVTASLDKAVDRGKLDAGDRDATVDRITWTSALADLAGCDLVIEAAVENLELKRTIFAELESVLSADAIMATNTSSIPVVDIAMATTRPERVLGVHFFNPAPVMKLVEVIATERTDRAVADRVMAFVADVLGKRVVPSRDRAGFVVNALLVPYICQAITMFDTGHASATDIDDAMVLGAGHPMGPLTLADLIGLDVCLAVAESLHEEYAERVYAPPPLLRRMVAAGHLGRKTGRGFHRY
jgi:3-hydroxybutyryl-CoA dehydrogenase